MIGCCLIACATSVRIVSICACAQKDGYRSVLMPFAANTRSRISIQPAAARNGFTTNPPKSPFTASRFEGSLLAASSIGASSRVPIFRLRADCERLDFWMAPQPICLAIEFYARNISAVKMFFGHTRQPELLVNEIGVSVHRQPYTSRCNRFFASSSRMYRALLGQSSDSGSGPGASFCTAASRAFRCCAFTWCTALAARVCESLPIAYFLVNFQRESEPSKMKPLSDSVRNSSSTFTSSKPRAVNWATISRFVSGISRIMSRTIAVAPLS
jgi:hypothetical protein